MSSESPVVIVGGGWAGLTTAVELVRHDIPVILLESAKQLGGRARRVPLENLSKTNDNDDDTDWDNAPSDNSSPEKISVDNGQHLLVGAYDSTLTMLRSIGVSENSVLKREKLVLNMRRIKNRDVRMETGRLPAPLHIAWGLLFASGLSLADRIRALKFCQAMSKSDFTVPSDISCLELFSRYQQTRNIVNTIWEPLCLAALNTPIDSASAVVFLRILRETFSYTRSESDLLFTRVDLGSIYPDPAMDYIEKHGGNIRLGQRVVSLMIDNNKLKGVKLQEGEIEAQHIVLATPHFATRKLLASHSMFAGLTEQLDKLGTQPIVTVYLQYPEHVTLNAAMVGLVGTTAQWVFDRRIYDQAGLMAVVISSDGPHMEIDNEQLAEKVQQELAKFFPEWPAPETRMVIREKRATFNCVVNCNDYRPGAETELPGLWLAGDYTNTDLPATLESAVRSGKRCAQSIIKARRDSES
jgi:squalene-associated FAD-dependent desaturase